MIMIKSRPEVEIATASEGEGLSASVSQEQKDHLTECQRWAYSSCGIFGYCLLFNHPL